MTNTALKQEILSSDRPLVLVVDDEKLICATLAQVLADENYRTIVAYDGAEALEKVAQYQPALVFLDIWMPGWDGIETLERIKDISPLTEVIVMSGHANVSNALEASKRGAFDFIEKPLDIENIMLALKRALERRDTLIDELQARGMPEEAAERMRSRKLDVAESSMPLLSHQGILSKGLAGKNIGQRTLKRGAILYGHCLHSGQKSGLVFEPLPLNSGIHFARIGGSKTVPAYVDFVERTGFATTVRSGVTSAQTIEHLMSALHAYKISNLLVKCNAEVPIFDGSAREFCNIIEQVGIDEQGGDWFELALDESFRFEASVDQAGSLSEVVSIEPHDSFKITYELDYPHPVGRQVYEYTLDSIESYKREIAPARTFGFIKDIERLQKAGLAAGGRLDNFILIGLDRIINTELRFENELVRHKILDLIGDLFLLGRPLLGHVRARMTGHSDNVGLLRTFQERAMSSTATNA